MPISGRISWMEVRFESPWGTGIFNILAFQPTFSAHFIFSFYYDQCDKFRSMFNGFSRWVIYLVSSLSLSRICLKFRMAIIFYQTRAVKVIALNSIYSPCTAKRSLSFLSPASDMCHMKCGFRKCLGFRNVNLNGTKKPTAITSQHDFSLQMANKYIFPIWVWWREKDRVRKK